MPPSHFKAAATLAISHQLRSAIGDLLMDGGVTAAYWHGELASR